MTRSDDNIQPDLTRPDDVPEADLIEQSQRAELRIDPDEDAPVSGAVVDVFVPGGDLG